MHEGLPPGCVPPLVTEIRRTLALLALLVTEPQAAAAAWNSTVAGVLNAASGYFPACRMGLPKAVSLAWLYSAQRFFRPALMRRRTWSLSIRFQKLDRERRSV